MDIMTTTQKTEEEISTANQNVIQPEQSVITQPAVTTKQTKKPVSYNLKEYERNPGEDIFSYIERVGQENIDKYNANVDRYAVYLNPEDYEEINDLVNINPNATPEERDAERYKIASAMKYSKYYDIPLDEAYKNIEQFNYSIFGPNHENYTKGFFKSLVDSLSLGQNTLEMGMIGSQIRDARSKGDTETVERLSQIYNKMKSENELYQKNLPQNLAMKIVEAGAQSLPFTTGAIVTSLFNPVAGFIFSAGTMAGTEYMDLMEMGAEHETATVVSSIAGALEGIIEVELGNVAGALGSKVTGSKASELVRRNVIDKVTKSVAEKMHYSGGWRVITNLLMRYGLENLEEGAEEAAQESISLFAKHIVNSVDKLGLESMSVKEIADDLKENFMGGLYGSILLGSGNLLMNSIATKADYDAVKKAAEVIPSEKSFAKAVENNKAFAEMNEETKAQTIHEVYQKYQSKRDADLQKKAESLSEVISADENMESYEAETDENGNELEAPEVPAETRDEKGKLYSQQDEVTENEDGTYSGRKVYGDATKQDKNQYGYISYTVDEDNGTVTIDDFKTNKYRQYLNNEMFADFAADFADYNIVWNAQLEDAKKWKSEIKALNPRGKENGLNYFTNKNLSEEEKRDQQTRQRLVRELGQNFNINGEQKAFTVAMIEAMAKSQGKSISAWVSEKFLDSGIMGDIEDLKKAAYQESINRNEEIEVNGGMALIDTVKGVKAIIYAAEGADLSTALHEFSHVWTKGLTGELEAEAANVFGATKNKDGTYNWDAKVTLSNGREISAYENLAYSYEKWLETGKAPTPQHENIFRKFAEFMKHCVKSLRSAIKLKPETEEFFNKYFSVTDGMVKTAEKAVIEEEANNASDVNSSSVEDLVNGSGIAEENITKSQENLTETEQTVKQTKLDPVTQEAVSSILEDPEIPADKKVAAVVKANGEAFVMKQENIEYYKNRTDLTEEERAQAVKDLEENNDTDRAGTGIPNSLLKSGKSMLFQIIGEKGAQALDEANEETFRMDNRRIAEEMENAGKDAKTILMATGWQKGADGKWKYEIPDFKIKENAVFKDGKSYLTEEEKTYMVPDGRDEKGAYVELEAEMKLSDLIEDVEGLLKAYPEFADMKVIKSSLGDNVRGSFDGKRISLSDKLFSETEPGTYKLNDEKHTVIHEIQHAIQDKEGFATGGNLESFTPGMEPPAITKALASYSGYTKEELKDFTAEKVRNQFLNLGITEEELSEWSPDIEGLGTVEEIIERDIRDHGVDWTYEEIQSARELVDNAGKIVIDGKKYSSSLEAYRSIAGEVESRNTQLRADMTMEERREQLLEDTEDVARDEQIIMHDKRHALSVETEKQRKTASHPWNEVNKEVYTNAEYSELVADKKLHSAAKEGDINAAHKICERIVNKEFVKKLCEEHPDAIVVPAPSMETSEEKPNALPYEYAMYFEFNGLEIAESIFEIYSAHHTHSNVIQRVMDQPIFAGKVEAGKEYIIVDDVFTMGGTINTLRNFIEDNGGHVVAISTLTAGKNGNKIIAITDETLAAVKAKDKELKGELLNAIKQNGIAENFESLTQPIGDFLSKINDTQWRQILDFRRSRTTQTGRSSNVGRSQKASRKKRLGNFIINNILFQEAEPVESGNFKNWFKNSKIVDESGAPKPLYHQTANDFDVFDVNHGGAGTSDYGTPNGIFLKPNANNIGLRGNKQLKLYASIQNPEYFNDRKALEDKVTAESSEYKKLLEEYKRIDKEYDERYEEIDKKVDAEYAELYEQRDSLSQEEWEAKVEEIINQDQALLDEWKAETNKLASEMKKVMTQYFIDKGIDGIIIENDEGSLGRKVNTTIAFSPNQVKSATDNNGDFSTSNPSILFQETINDDILNTAAGFENWVDFMEYMQDVEPDAVPEEAASDWYLNTWEIAHNASPTSAEREAQVMADREEQNQNEKKDPVFLDGLFLHEIQKEGNLENFLKLVNKVSEISEDEINQLDEEDRGIILNELKKIDTVLSHPTIVNARKALNSKNELKPGHRERIISLMRGRIRDYRAVYADITGRTEYSVEQNESLDAELAARARRFNLITYDSEVENMSPEMKRALEKYVKDKEVLKKFKEDKVKMDDPDVEHYISMLEAQVKNAEKNLKDARNEFQDDMEALGSMQMRDIIKQYHDFLQQKSEADYRKVALPAGTKKALRLGEKAERQQQSGMRQNYNTLAANWDTFKTELAANIKTEERLRSEGKMQEILERYKKNYDATRSETVQELMKKAESLITLKKNHGDVLNELYAVRQLKDQRKALVKRAMRRVNFSTIDYEQAKKIIAIQKVFEPNLHGGVNKWIGTEKAMAREVWTAWVTDEVAQEKILNRLSLKGKTDLIKLLEDTKTEEDFEKWTSKQQKDLEKAMPMKDWVKALNLDAWKEERDGALQLDIKPVTRTRYETQKDGSKKAVQYEAVEMSSEVEEMLINAIGMDMTYAIQNRKFDSWTTGEMIELTKKINKLFKEGRDKLEAKRQAEKMESDLLRELIRQNIKDTGIVINPDDPEDVKKKKQAKINKILGIEHAFPGTEASRKEKEQTWLDRVLHGYHDANVRRVARILDNYDESAATNLLYFRENDCFNKEQRAIDRRNSKIEKVIEDNKLDIRKLGQVSEFYGSKFTVDEILMLHAAVMNQNDFYAEQLKDDPSLKPEQAEKESAWQAIVYGNLITPEEREKFRKMDNEVLEKEKERLDSLHAAELAGDKDKIEKYKVREASTVDLNGNLILTGTEALKTLAESRLNGIIFETQNIKNEFKPLIDAIRADYASEFDNINKISIEEFNAPVWREKWYLPLVRLTAAGDTHEQRLKQDLLGHTAGTGKAGTEKGFTKKRIKIGPLNQAPVELGLYKTWADSVERNEHFVAYAGLVREYNRVFDSRDALGMMQDIENRYGHAMTDYIKSYIKEVANPKLMEPKKGLDKVMHIMRGNTAPAYLGWKFSSILKQGIESPAPFMQFVNPAEYMHAAIKMATDKNTRESIERKSAFMKSRVFDPMVDLINENVEKSFNKPGYALKKFQQVGMSGLEWIDWACVAPGWLAVYDKEYRKLQETEQNRYEARVAELTEQNETRNGKFRMTEEQIKQQAMDDVAQDIEEAAVLKADDCVRLCQPSNRNVDLAPMFKNNSEAAKAVLQFQTALNVIWQNIRYDIPYAMRKKEWKQIVGMILGYVMAGVMSGVVCSGLLKDDDEPEDTAKRLGYYATTQFLDSVPIVGGNLERLAERAITGEGGPMFGSSLWPTFDKYYNAASAFIKEDYEKALKNMTQGLAISLGLPLSGTKEAAALLGIGDGDGELELNPGALAGRRD